MKHYLFLIIVIALISCNSDTAEKKNTTDSFVNGITRNFIKDTLQYDSTLGKQISLCNFYYDNAEGEKEDIKFILAHKLNNVDSLQIKTLCDSFITYIKKDGSFNGFKKYHVEAMNDAGVGSYKFLY